MNSEFEPDASGASQATQEAASRRRLVSELLDRRRTAQARPLIGAALQEDPDDLGMLFEAARADWIDDRDTEARQRIGEILQRDPEHVDARFFLLTMLTHAGELPQAEAQALSLLQAYPHSSALYVAYAQVMLRSLQLPKASALIAEALRLSPNDPDALRMRALCDLVLGVRGVDSLALKRLLVEHPEDQGTLAVLVSSLAEAGRYREALRCSRQLLLANPNHPHWIRVTRELVAATHWSMAPLRPLQRFGWTGSIVFWVASVLLLRVIAVRAPQAVGVLSVAILGYCVYSWVWPPLFRKWILRG